MKREKFENKSAKSGDRRVIRHRTREPDRVTEMLKLCLQRICELQAEMNQVDEEVHDPEAEGYTACAMETLRFLTAQGMSPDHPVVRALTDRLLRNRD
ncbi:uncharacterized protein LOC115891632 [Sitophilus oryzae]|uniref:Uncharacterized protein LOC115891632 n=1 Tax=Sitophilus oryzae TaxID=7048 RepID=A0A6J2YXM9_SITOR|nr:uncharacterized protein LOC115891632 [Sitophilus oryzae]